MFETDEVSAFVGNKLAQPYMQRAAAPAITEHVRVLTEFIIAYTLQPPYPL